MVPWQRLKSEAKLLSIDTEASSCLPSFQPPEKLHSWSDELMLGALDAVKCGKIGLNSTALQFGIPCTTLKDRIAGRVVHGTRCGLKP